MANVAKICEIIFGANPTEDDLRAIIERLNERLPKVTPMVDPQGASSDEPTEKVSKPNRRSQS